MKKKTVEHINHALVAKAHTPMYLMHKYWARKPHNVVSEYIEHYSKPGDIVLDPFCGSGPTPIEAIKLGRKGIGIDLNPVSAFITRMTAIPADISKIEVAFQEIKEKCEKEINELYKTICPKCKKEALTVYTIKENEKIIEIGYECKKCLTSKKSSKRFLIKKPDDFDFRLIEKIEKMGIPYWYPTTRLAYNEDEFKEGTHDPNFDSVDKLFDKRALISLSLLYNEIEKIKEEKIRDIFKIIFTSNVHNVSKLNPVHQPRWKSGVHPSTSWILHRFWLPTLRVECPVWFYFEERYKHIVDAKTDSNNQIKYYKEAKKFEDLNDGANIFIKTHNALELTDIIPSNSVDYVFTDPPYGGAIQYFELSTLWASWLKLDLEYKDEITINKQQDKDFDFYHKMLAAAFRQVYQALKLGKYMTVTFHSTDIKVWNSIIKAVVLSGFDLEKIIYQPPARPSAKGLLQPYGSAVGDYYIRFHKPEKEALVTEKEVDLQTYELTVVDIAKNIIGERAEPTMYQHILNGIMVELHGGRNVPVGARNIEDVLKSHVGKEFELIPVKDDRGKTVGKKWWVKGWDMTHFTKPALSDRVERSVFTLLNTRVKVSFDDILEAIFIEYPNALTPETQDILSIVEEYAKKTSDGKWMLKPIEKEYASNHTKMIYLLALLGKKAGFDVLIGTNEQSPAYSGKRLSELCDREPTFRFIAGNEDTMDRIKQIDVIWHDSGRIKYTFEVENTTGITDAITRGSNIRPVVPGQKLDVKRFIVIPEKRENLLYRKLREPLLKESVEKEGWTFVFYKDLVQLYDAHKRKKEFTPTELTRRGRVLKFNNEVQAKINEFN